MGAGIYSLAEDGVADENEVTIINSTIAYNSTSPCIGCIGAGAGLRTTDGTIDVVGSIVAYNSETNGGKIAYINCSASPPAKIVSLGYNLETGTDCGFESTGDLPSTSPDFSSSTPQNNGGNTDALAPEPTSPAVNAIPTSWSFCDGVDQRGITRPQGAGCDIGAVELASAVTPPPPPTPTRRHRHHPPHSQRSSRPRHRRPIDDQRGVYDHGGSGGAGNVGALRIGPVLPGAKTAAITYGSVTPDQSVVPDFANHTVTATVTGLLPNVTYNVRAVATNSAGSAVGANQALVTPADPPPPPPVLGKSVNVTPVSGVVYIELPPGANLAAVSPFSSGSLGMQAFAALAKGQRFIPLTEARRSLWARCSKRPGESPGSRRRASKPKGQQFGDFGGGIFKLLQNRKQKGLTDLDIVDNHSAGQVCATLGKKVRRSRPS